MATAPPPPPESGTKYVALLAGVVLTLAVTLVVVLINRGDDTVAATIGSPNSTEPGTSLPATTEPATTAAAVTTAPSTTTTSAPPVCAEPGTVIFDGFDPATPCLVSLDPVGTVGFIAYESGYGVITTPGGYFFVAYYPQAVVGDATVSMEFRPLGSATARYVLVFALSEPSYGVVERGAAAFVSPGQNLATAYVWDENGLGSAEGFPIPVGANLDPTGWTELRVVITAGVARVFVNGVEAMSLTLPATLGPGYTGVGITGEAGDSMQVDNVRVVVP